MITIWDENENISQASYDKMINSISLRQLKCSCGCSGRLTMHASYERGVKTAEGRIHLRIVRVRCRGCHVSHALLPSSIVPCSQVSLFDQVEIVNAFEKGKDYEKIMERNPEIDTNYIYRILSIYILVWRERLKKKQIVFSSIKNLIHECFSYYSCQFMQIKNIPNIFFEKVFT